VNKKKVLLCIGFVVIVVLVLCLVIVLRNGSRSDNNYVDYSDISTEGGNEQEVYESLVNVNVDVIELQEFDDSTIDALMDKILVYCTDNGIRDTTIYYTDILSDGTFVFTVVDTGEQFNITL
jgi:hypothetical protein